MNMNKEEKHILLAFFDILGTSRMLNNGDYRTVYDYYAYMAKLCSDTHTPIAIVDHVSQFLNPEMDHSRVRYTIVNYELKHCFFSDTFLLWIEVDSFHQPTMAGFLEKCCIIFCEALKRGIPLRGVISAGTAIMDEEKHILKAEPRQKWVGVSLGQSIFNIHPMDMRYILPYFKHRKNDNETLLSGWVLDWPSWWRENEEFDAIPFVNQMNINPEFGEYYSNCISFYETSKQRVHIWNMFMIFQDVHKLSKLCALGNSINDNQRITRQEGIKILTSQKVLTCIQHILNSNESNWLCESDRNLLVHLQNGYILVNEKLICMNDYKEAATLEV